MYKNPIKAGDATYYVTAQTYDATNEAAIDTCKEYINDITRSKCPV